MVTFFRGLAGGAPSGEWELCRTKHADGGGGDATMLGNNGRVIEGN